MSFVLDFVTADQAFNTPTDATTALSLSGAYYDSTNTKIADLTIDADSQVDLGDIGEEVTTYRIHGQHGQLAQSLYRPDRVLKFTVVVTADSPTHLKQAVYKMISIVESATAYYASTANKGGSPELVGQPFFLKYQPDTTTNPVYFKILHGRVDLTNYNDQVKLLTNMAYVPVELTVFYAAYSPAVYLRNLVPNGTFTHGKDGWTAANGHLYSGQPSINGNPDIGFFWCFDNDVLTDDIPDAVSNTFNRNGNKDWYIGTSPIYGSTKRSDAIGYSCLWNYCKDVWGLCEYINYSATGGTPGAGSDTIYSKEISIRGYQEKDTSCKVWLSLEGRFNIFPNVTSPTAKVEAYDWTNNTWTQVGTTLTLTPDSVNYKKWKQFAWPSAISIPTRSQASSTTSPSSETSNYNSSTGQYQPPGNIVWIKLRVRIDVASNFASSYVPNYPGGYAILFEFRKVALWEFPPYMPDSMVKLPSEYMVQPYNSTQPMVLWGLQGNVETTGRIKIRNDKPADVNPYNPYVLQTLQLGSRKMQGIPAPFFVDYTNGTGTAVSIPVQSGYNSSAATTFYSLTSVPYMDAIQRKYRVLARLATSDKCGVGIGGSTQYSGAQGFSTFNTIVPNGLVSEIPNTGGVVQTLDLGVVTLPVSRTGFFGKNNNGKTGKGLQLLMTAFNRVSSSGTAQINISLYYMWFIPLDNYNYVDTRVQTADLTSNSWYNAVGTGSSDTFMRELTIDSLMRESPNIYLANSQELPDSTYPLAPLATYSPIKVYPQTDISLQPMMFGAVVRRAGSNGVAAADVMISDLINYGFMYCPAWSF